MGSRTEPRVATSADVERVTEILADAFDTDPVWGEWAFPYPRYRSASPRAFWRFYVEAGVANEGVWLSANDEAAAVWTPPGRVEVPEEEEPRLERLLVELVGAEHAAVIVEGMSRFEANHPTGEPHYYLGLLGTHSDHRGKGLGMQLLADNIARIDAEGAAAYLESTNPANDGRYERLGFERRGEFRLPAGGPRVATMWRPARPRAD